MSTKNPISQFPKMPPKNSNQNPICKTLIVILLLLAIPFFPSQSPHFIPDHLWEFLHLLFIGIAVSYGLFSSKTHSISAHLEASQPCLSGISDLSSVFGDGFDNLCGFDELNDVKIGSLVSDEGIVKRGNDGSRAVLSGVSSVSSVNGDGFDNVCVLDEENGGKVGSFVSNECNVRRGNEGSRVVLSGVSRLSSVNGDGFDNVCEENGRKVGSLVSNEGNVRRVSEGSRLSSVLEDGFDNVCVFDEENGGKVGSFVSNECNVRRVNKQVWRSEYSKGEALVVVSNGKYFVDKGNDFKPLNLPIRSLRSSVSGNDEPELGNRGEFTPPPELDVVKGGDDDSGVNVSKIRGVTPLNLERRFEEVSGTTPPPSIPWRSRSGRMGNGKGFVHCRPHSVGEFEFENFKARSARGVTFSSSPELSSSKVEYSDRDQGKERLDADVSFSIGASSEMRDFECNVKKFGYNGNEGKMGKGKQGIESLDSDVKPLGLAKAVSRAKSVRTIKPSNGTRYIVDEKEKYPSQVDRTFGRTFTRERGEEPENPTINYQNHESDKFFAMPKPKPTLLEYRDEEKEEDIGDGNVTECGDEDETKSEVDESSGEDEARNNVENDAELEGSEVDRKAGEFIAKFREQIRLQKMSSVRGH